MMDLAVTVGTEKEEGLYFSLDFCPLLPEPSVRRVSAANLRHVDVEARPCPSFARTEQGGSLPSGHLLTRTATAR